MPKIGLAAFMCLTAGCAHDGSKLFIGRLNPVSGVCDPGAQAQLAVRENELLFIPAGGTLVLHGKQTGTELFATNILNGVDRRSYVLTFRGRLQGENVTGTYQTARCRYSVSLHPAAD